jgi:serine/threonine-protein kinase RsbW
MTSDRGGDDTMALEQSKVRDVVELKIPSAPEYIRLARLTMAGIGTQLKLSFDEIEDLKIAVAEACTNALLHGSPNQREEEILIRYTIEDNQLIISVTDNGTGFDCTEITVPNPKELIPGGLGIFLIRALVDEVDILGCPERGTEVKMVKYLPEGCCNA